MNARCGDGADSPRLECAPNSATARALIAHHGAGLVRWRAPLLLGVFGLPGTGKTEVARWLAARYPLIVLSTDAIRLRYDLPSGPATLDVLYDVAAALLPRGAGIVLDGIHLGVRDRARFRAFAESQAASGALLFTTAARDVVAERLAAREADAARTAAEGKFVITPGHFARIASWLKKLGADEAVWRIDTTGDRFAGDLAALTGWLDRHLPPTDGAR